MFQRGNLATICGGSVSVDAIDTKHTCNRCKFRIRKNAYHSKDANFALLIFIVVKQFHASAVYFQT